MKVLEFGCGCGVIAVAAASWGAEVTAIDINAHAVVATRENAAKLGLDGRLRSLESDGFKGLSDSYDLIIANLPIVDAKPPGHEGPDPWGLFDPGWKLHRHFRDSYQLHLRDDGFALICHAEIPRNTTFMEFEDFMRTGRNHCRVVHESTIEGIVWRIYQVLPIRAVDLSGPETEVRS